MDITVEKLQFFLETAWTNCKPAANTLRDQMFIYETSVRNTASGGTLGSMAKNNASHSYKGPGLGQYTPDQLGDAWRMLINFYDDSLDYIKWAIANPPTPLPSGWPTQPADGDYDSLCYDRMREILRRNITEYQIDISCLRLHPTLGNPQEVFTW
jgi:hypothetical protein